MVHASRSSYLQHRSPPLVGACQGGKTENGKSRPARTKGVIPARHETRERVNIAWKAQIRQAWIMYHRHPLSQRAAGNRESE